MKRVYTALVLLVILCAVNFVTTHHLQAQSTALLAQIVNLQKALPREDDSLRQPLQDFCDHWNTAEQAMSRYIRHTQIDEISKTVARLNALLEYQKYDDLAASLDEVQFLLEHLVKFEQPNIFNVL